MTSRKSWGWSQGVCYLPRCYQSATSWGADGKI